MIQNQGITQFYFLIRPAKGLFFDSDFPSVFPFVFFLLSFSFCLSPFVFPVFLFVCGFCWWCNLFILSWCGASWLSGGLSFAFACSFYFVLAFSQRTDG